MKKVFKSKISVVIACLVALVVVLSGTVGLYASGALATKSVSASGTITVTTPATFGITLYSNEACTTELTTLDFSGSVLIGSTYSKSKTIYVKNTGVNGTGQSAMLHSVIATAEGLPEGWTLTGSITNPIAQNASQALYVTISSGTLTLTEGINLSEVTINIEAN